MAKNEEIELYLKYIGLKSLIKKIDDNDNNLLYAYASLS